MFCDEHGTADYCGECVYGPEIEALQQQLAASQSEARELRAELVRVRELVSGMREYADSCDHPSEVSKRNAVEYWLTQLEDIFSLPSDQKDIDRKPVVFEDRQCCPDGGRCHHDCGAECWRTYHASPLSVSGLNDDWTFKPATERPAERESLPLMARRGWMRRDTDYFVVHDDFCLEVKALNGRAPYYDESGELVVCAEAGDSIERDRVDAEAQPDGIYRIADTDEHSLPLMARREWMFKGAKYAYRDRDSGWFQSVYKPGRAWEFCYRIVDTDEHGLKAVPREPGMPEWARYRWPTYGGFAYSVVFAPWMRLSSEVARIEDYRESGQEGKK